MSTTQTMVGGAWSDPGVAEREIFAEQVRQLYRLSRVSYADTLINAVIILIALWGHIPGFLLISWSALVLIVIGARIAIYRAFTSSQPATGDIGIWCRRFVWGTAAMGCLWGVLGSAPPPHSA